MNQDKNIKPYPLLKRYATNEYPINIQNNMAAQAITARRVELGISHQGFIAYIPGFESIWPDTRTVMTDEAIETVLDHLPTSMIRLLSALRWSSEEFEEKTGLTIYEPEIVLQFSNATFVSPEEFVLAYIDDLAVSVDSNNSPEIGTYQVHVPGANSLYSGYTGY